MNLLAIDTSTEYCSLALAAGGSVSSLHFLAGQRHAELALDGVRRLMVQAGLEFADLDGIAYGQGPGSFTGLRIACGMAQGLALAQGLGVVGISSLEAMAEEAAEQAAGEAAGEGPGRRRVVACLDARMGEVYHAAYESDVKAHWRSVRAPGLYAPGDVPELPGNEWLACGSGFAAHGDMLLARYRGQLAAVAVDCVPTARAMLRLAQPVFAAGNAGGAAQALPLYLRNKVALTEVERQAGRRSG
jgi:tRNA threonylcarbamoyladenosine biosynthesis protein TsaB